MSKIYWSKLRADDLERINLSFEDFFKILDCYYGNIFVTDGKGIVLYFNEAEWSKWGLSRKKHIGKHISYFFEQGIFKKSATEEVLRAKKEIMMETVDYEGRPLWVYAVPIFDDDDQIILTVHYSQRQKEIERFLEEIESSKRIINQISGVLELYNIEKDMKLIYQSEKMFNLVRLAKRVAKTDGAVLIDGESGTGKELLARYIFKEGHRSNGVFLPINCAAIPNELMESELFGYAAGSFTGASRRGKAGVFELADKGTIFLDEIGELPLQMQSKLLRVLESGEIIRVGATSPQWVDVRIIAATNRDLQEMVRKKTFREDLYYRLNVIPLSLPPLRERPEDILPLADFYLKEYNARYHVSKRFSDGCREMFAAYRWPGNVRELKNLVHRMVIATEDTILEAVELEPGCSPTIPLVPSPKDSLAEFPQVSLKAALRNYELEYIRQAIKATGGNVSKAAESLGVHRSYLYRKLHLRETEKDASYPCTW